MSSIAQKSFWPQSAYRHRSKNIPAFSAHGLSQLLRCFIFILFRGRPSGWILLMPWTLAVTKNLFPAVWFRPDILQILWISTFSQEVGAFWTFGGKNTRAHEGSWRYGCCRKWCFQRHPYFRRLQVRFWVFLIRFFFQTYFPWDEFWQKSARGSFASQ